jgi:hypothetical protein
MKVTVVKEFRDLYDFAVKYEVGKECEFKGERLQKLLALGLVKATKPQAQETATESSAQEVENKPKRKYTKRDN